MTIIETLKQLRDDIKTWVTNNLVALNEKVDDINNFSGDYNDLTNKPEILEDSSDSFNITDPSGNIILKVDENGLATTNVDAKTITLNGQSLAGVVDEVTNLNDLVGDTAVSTQIENAINSKSYFSGDYNDLTNRPDILDDGSDRFVIADSSGNVILDVDVEGLKTTAVSINGEDVAEKIKSVNDALDDHADNKVAHITAAERKSWNEKSEFSGSYHDLTDKPNILDDESENFTVADSDGNIILSVGESGLSTTHVHAKSVILDGQIFTGDYDELTNKPNVLDDGSDSFIVADDNGNVVFKVDENGLNTTSIAIKGEDILEKIDSEIFTVNDAIDNHIKDTEAHITSEERESWNNKSEFSGDYNDLTNKPNLVDDGDDSLHIADDSGNIIMTVDENGVTTKDVIIGGAKVSETIKTVSENAAEWNAKATTAYVDQKVADLVDSSPETLDTLNELAEALGDDPNFAATIAEQIGLKADAEHDHDDIYYQKGSIDLFVQVLGNALQEKATQADLDTHTSNTVAHITSEERETWNNISNIKDDGTGVLNITDSSGNIIVTVDENGISTTALSLNGANIQPIIDGKVDKEDGKGLSTEDYTTDEKTKLAGIDVGANKYIHPTYTEADLGLYKVSVDEEGHVASTTAVTKADITALGIPAQDTTYDAAGVDFGLVKSGGDVTIDNGVITINNDSHSHTISNIGGLQDSLDEINSALADIQYKAITFTSFTNNVGTVELGSTVNSVKLTWETNKTPTTLTLNDVAIDASLKEYTYNDLALKPTSVTTKKYTILATDDREASASKETSFSFVNGVYYGVIDQSATIDSATVLKMNRKLQNSRGMTITITPGATEYIAFAFPSRLGVPTFKMGGFETTCICTQIQFTNASGYTETYNVYTTTNTGLGKTEVVVS